MLSDVVITPDWHLKTREMAGADVTWPEISPVQNPVSKKRLDLANLT